ncbi:MAG TPA: GNAT family N-acetyltransferase [Ferrovibrio sp.]|jgi:predicted GNAT family acetyltransferase|uniref:GNAT family N-acetyltransferase n=1 Tax=Ferrovibrio sp. TaxID=1917215 RepID=UPI002ED3ECCA
MTAASPVIDNAAHHRFEITVDGAVAFASYRRADGIVTIAHVEAPPQLRGTGAASRLMQGIMERLRAEGVKVVPHCSYAAAWLKRHQEFADMLA